ncbi:hypothetical protein [Adhaeribacter radiodurans]|uniref:Uncharacterized protein n=1 Tax=Adhaeribacter radiodurans TaxID=2745197 RepID=A0A7L7LDN9_9BACT|nr:hypothetical protein [Adhaeribacter radiodurans]QMU30519.1 hypothetical protein HUW48_21945 [Adhaeribacter radiodurans]
MAIQVSNLTATPSSVSLPKSIKLDFMITAEKGTPVKIIYQIRPHIDVAFVRNGIKTKQITQLVKLGSSSQNFHEKVDLVMIDSNLDFSEMPLQVRAENTLDLSSDTESCRIIFKRSLDAKIV